jgi:hypothetical protein
MTGAVGGRMPLAMRHSDARRASARAVVVRGKPNVSRDARRDFGMERAFERVGNNRKGENR